MEFTLNTDGMVVFSVEWIHTNISNIRSETWRWD